MAQQQESFLPFSMAAKSLLLPKPRGKKHSKTSWSSLLSFRTAWSFSPLQNLVGLLFPSEPHGLLLLPQNLVVLPTTLEPRGLFPIYFWSRVVSSFFPKTLWSSLLLWSRVVSSLLQSRMVSSYSMAAGPRF